MADHHDVGGKSSNKIAEIVRLQQMLKKWKKLAVASGKNAGGGRKSGFLKRTLSFTDPGSEEDLPGVPKGFLAVCVGEERRRFVIPTEYLSHAAFLSLLRQAEEEFGFQQEGVLRIPCEVSVFQSALEAVDEKKKRRKKKKEKEEDFLCCSSEAELPPPPTAHKPLCR